MAAQLNKELVKKIPSIRDHKVVVHVTIGEQWGQGCKVVGKCLWNSNCDRVVTVDVSNDSEICLASAFFSKIPEDSSDEESEEVFG